MSGTAVLPQSRFQRVHRIQSDHKNGCLVLCLRGADLFMLKTSSGRPRQGPRARI